MDEIETSRIRLRHFTLDDLDDLAAIFSDPLVLKYLSPGRAATREETETALVSMIRHWERHGYGRWAAVWRETGKLVGYGGLRSFEGTPELVYLLARPYWGHGLATEIALACLEYGFMHHGFEQIIALTRPNNSASRRVMEKIGLNYEGFVTVFNLEVVRYSMTRANYLLRPFIARAAADSADKFSASALK